MQAKGVARNDTNLHVEPGRKTEHLYQILAGEKLDVLKRDATVPFSTGEAFPGLGKDYIDRVTESQAEVGEQAAEWLVKTLNGKGNIIMFGGTPGNPMTAAQTTGWRPYFAKYPGIKVLEAEPVPTMWDPAVAQQKTAALIAKYPQIDGIYSETVGPIRAFVAAGKPIPAYVGQSLMDLSCLAAEHPEMKMMSIDAHTWMVRNALRKGLGRRQRHGQRRAEPDQAADHRGHHVEGSEARAEVRQVDADGFDPVVDAEQRTAGQGARRQITQPQRQSLLTRWPQPLGAEAVHLSRSCSGGRRQVRSLRSLRSFSVAVGN